MEESKRYKLMQDSVFAWPHSPSMTVVVRKDQVATFNGYEDSGTVLVRYPHLIHNRDYTALISRAFLEEILPVPAPVDRAAWREGIEAVQAYLPAMSTGFWFWLQDRHRPLHEGLRKMQANGPDND